MSTLTLIALLCRRWLRGMRMVPWGKSMMGAARTFGTSFDELSDGDGIAFSFGTHLQVKSESPAIIGNRIPLQFFPRSTTPHTHEARGIRGENHCSTLAT